MSEYDYSREAYEQALDTNYRIANWIDHQKGSKPKDPSRPAKRPSGMMNRLVRQPSSLAPSDSATQLGGLLPPLPISAPPPPQPPPVKYTVSTSGKIRSPSTDSKERRRHGRSASFSAGDGRPGLTVIPPVPPLPMMAGARPGHGLPPPPQPIVIPPSSRPHTARPVRRTTYDGVHMPLPPPIPQHGRSPPHAHPHQHHHPVLPMPVPLPSAPLSHQHPVPIMYHTVDPYGRRPATAIDPKYFQKHHVPMQEAVPPPGHYFVQAPMPPPYAGGRGVRTPTPSSRSRTPDSASLSRSPKKDVPLLKRIFGFGRSPTSPTSQTFSHSSSRPTTPGSEKSSRPHHHYSQSDPQVTKRPTPSKRATTPHHSSHAKAPSGGSSETRRRRHSTSGSY